MKIFAWYHNLFSSFIKLDKTLKNNHFSTFYMCYFLWFTHKIWGPILTITIYKFEDLFNFTDFVFLRIKLKKKKKERKMASMKKKWKNTFFVPRFLKHWREEELVILPIESVWPQLQVRLTTVLLSLCYNAIYTHTKKKT